MEYLDGLSLGKEVEYSAEYSPELLQPIPRLLTRENLGIDPVTLPFNGGDFWNAYELSWLNPKGLPQVACAVFYLPCDSEAIIESKSFKLYLNSYNQTVFESIDAVKARLSADLSQAAGGVVKVELQMPQDWPQQFSDDWQDAQLLDQQDITINSYSTDASVLLAAGGEKPVKERLQSHLLRSLCPVTGQPDWGSVLIEYSGQPISHEGLLRYIVSFREHQEFHEQCVERIFIDLMAKFDLEQLTVYARYVRRGGLDINPYRSTADITPLNTRLFRQ